MCPPLSLAFFLLPLSPPPFSLWIQGLSVLPASVIMGEQGNQDQELKPGQDAHGIVPSASIVPFSLPF